MKVEVGEYIRTKQGTIGKAIEKYEKYCVISNTRGEIDVPYENIVKHSKNIIDLIEVGDIVKVEGIEHVREVIEDDFFNGNIFNNDVRAIINDKNYSKQIKEFQIKSIVTKEQFKGVKYEIK